MLKKSLLIGILIFSISAIDAKSIKNDSDHSELEVIRQTVLELTAKVQSLNETLQRNNDNVMFYAVMQGKSYTFNVDAILVFETVIVNEGGNYDHYDGVFVAPVKGIYLFSWTVSGSGTSYIVTELVVEEKIISSGGEYNAKGGNPSGSMTALCKMDKGDHVWIRTTGVSSSHYLYSAENYPQSAFLGLLVQHE